MAVLLLNTAGTDAKMFVVISASTPWNIRRTV